MTQTYESLQLMKLWGMYCLLKRNECYHSFVCSQYSQRSILKLVLNFSWKKHLNATSLSMIQYTQLSMLQSTLVNTTPSLENMPLFNTLSKYN